MNCRSLTVCAVPLVAGIALGYVLARPPEAPQPPPVGAEPAAESAAEPLEASAAVERALSDRIRKLEAEFAAHAAPTQTVEEGEAKFWKPIVRQNSDGTQTVTVRLVPTIDLRKMGEEKREKDPAEFEEWARYHREAAEERASAIDRRIVLLGQIDDGWMGEEDRAWFRDLQEKMKAASDGNRREGDWSLPFEERRQVEGVMWGAMTALPQEYPRLRRLLVGHVADVMGLESVAASDFVRKVDEIELYMSRHSSVR